MDRGFECHPLRTDKKSLLSYVVRQIKELKDRDVWEDFRMVDPFGFYLRFAELIYCGGK